MFLSSFSSRAQNGQSASEKIASLREPLPLTFFIASSSGRLSKATRESSRIFASVMFFLVAVSYRLPTRTYETLASVYTI